MFNLYVNHYALLTDKTNKDEPSSSNFLEAYTSLTQQRSGQVMFIHCDGAHMSRYRWPGSLSDNDQAMLSLQLLLISLSANDNLMTGMGNSVIASQDAWDYRAPL